MENITANTVLEELAAIALAKATTEKLVAMLSDESIWDQPV